MATCVRQKKGYFWLVLGVNQRKVLIIWIFKDKVKLYKDFREKFFFDLSPPLNKWFLHILYSFYVLSNAIMIDSISPLNPCQKD